MVSEICLMVILPFVRSYTKYSQRLVDCQEDLSGRSVAKDRRALSVIHLSYHSRPIRPAESPKALPPAPRTAIIKAH